MNLNDGFMLWAYIIRYMALPTVVDSIAVTDAHRKMAVENADTSHCDADMGRDADQHEIDARVGVLGEIMARDMVGQTDDVEFTDPEDVQHDCFLNGHRTEIKTRKTWNYSKPDLLVRKKFDLAARYYVQLDLHTENGNDPKLDLSNVSKAKIVGYVNKEEVETHGEDFSPPGKRDKNETVLINRRHLRPMHELHARIA